MGSDITEDARATHGVPMGVLEAERSKLEAELVSVRGAIEDASPELHRQLKKKRKALERITSEVRDAAKVRPQIQVNGRQLREVIHDAWQAELATEEHEADGRPLRLFARCGRVANLVRNLDALEIAMVDVDAMFAHLVERIDWYKVVEDGSLRPAQPPARLASAMLARPHINLPKLDAVAATPVFSHSGKLVAEPGYHPAERLWYQHNGLVPSDVPMVPTSADLDSARTLILTELLGDFVFASDADKTHAVAMLVLPFVRRLITGPTPFHMVEATTPGTGKNLLVSVCSLIALGRPVAVQTMDGREEETRKKITTELLKGEPIILLDNVKGGIDSAQLAAAITAEDWSDRLLGGNKAPRLPNSATWIATGNNPRLTTEIARRAVRIRLLALSDRPQERTGFRHPSLLEWAREHRRELVHAVLVIVRSWVAAGRPSGRRTMGSFESWARVMGGILHNAGFTGFLENADELFDLADTEGTEWRQFIAAWWKKFGSTERTPTELRDLALKEDLLPSVVRGEAPPRSQLARLAAALTRMRDRFFNEHKLLAVPNTHTKANVYYLTEVPPARGPT